MTRNAGGTLSAVDVSNFCADDAITRKMITSTSVTTVAQISQTSF